MPTEAGLATLCDSSDLQGAIQPFGYTADLLLMAAVARLPARHGRQCCIKGQWACKRGSDCHGDECDGGPWVSYTGAWRFAC
jgi:hypothetical protein